MKDAYRRRRTLWIWLGLGSLLIDYLWVTIPGLYYGLWIFGVAALIYGSYCWAKYKGRSGWFALLGLAAPIGFIPLAVMRDQYDDIETTKISAVEEIGNEESSVASPEQAIEGKRKRKITGVVTVCIVIITIAVAMVVHFKSAPMAVPTATMTYNQTLSAIYPVVDNISSRFFPNESDEAGAIYFLDKLGELGIDGGIVSINSKLGGKGNLDYCVAVNTIDKGVVFFTVLPSDSNIEDDEQRLQCVYLVKDEKIGLLPAKFAESSNYSWYIEYLDDVYQYYDHCEYLGRLSDLIDELGNSIGSFRMYALFGSCSQSDIDRANAVIAEYNDYVGDYNSKIDDALSRQSEYPETLFYVEEYTISPYVLPTIPVVPMPPYIIATADQLESEMESIANLDETSFHAERVTDKNFIVTGFSIKWTDRTTD